MVALLAIAPAAQATFHLIKVREVYAGTADDSYVELQMFAAGQSLLSGHSMTVYNAAGALLHSSTFSSGVAHSANQQTVLIGDSAVQTTFGAAPDLVDSSLSIPASGGAACWNAGGIPADCVTWGNFTGSAALATATGTTGGTPVSPGGITAGKAIRRKISSGCPTLLEESDDSNVSATDFEEVTPAPRNDSSAIVEHTCPGVPNTAIDDRPPQLSNSTSAEFTYEAPTATSYECKLDAAVFSGCPLLGPQEYTGLSQGSHTFQVRGVNSSGPDPTPATYTWTVDTVAPTATVTTHPPDPSPGTSASFKYTSNETNSSFKCRLSPNEVGFTACSVAGKTYVNLADGEYTFEVLATDAAGNAQTVPTTFPWTVDHTVIDSTPPETTITSHPPDPSESATASFGFESNEADSTFECKLDAAAFASCPASGIAYMGLANGPHTFQVRAIDPSDNVDATPAGFSFTVAVSPDPAPVPAPRPAPGSEPPPPIPDTVVAPKPAAKTRDRTPTIRFKSTVSGATFACKVDRGPFKSCRSPLTTKSLSFGHHTVKIRASARGLSDPTPATVSFKVVRE